MDENLIDTMDRISQLPESVAHHILSLLDSPQHLVRMSVLSKEWFTISASFPILDFNIDTVARALYAAGMPFDGFIRFNGCVKDKFFKYVAYTTARFCEQNVRAHKFNLITVLQDPTEVDIIDKCLELILKRGVKVLVVDIIHEPFVPKHLKHMPIYRLPNLHLSSSSLTSLRLQSCELPSSLMVDDVKFMYLKLLHLDSVPINEELIKYLTTSCPLLEEFTLYCCYGFKRFCVYEHQNLQEIQLIFKSGFERIDIEAPNLSYLLLVDRDNNGAPSMNLALCKKLKTLCYYGYPSPTLKGLADFSSNFPFLETLYLKLYRQCNNLKLASHSLKTFVLDSQCDLEEIDINIPNLLLFQYNGNLHMHYPFVRDLSESKTRLECYPENGYDTLWFQKLRHFLDKKNGFKILKLCIRSFYAQGLIDVEELKLSQWPPFELEDVELELDNLKDFSVYVAVVDAMLWCCRPQSLTLQANFPSTDFESISNYVKFTYEKLVQQEQGQTNIQFVLSSSSEVKQHFSDLNSLLTALPRDQKGQIITFIKEEVAYEER